MSLNAAAITELTSESAPLLIFDEWLAGYFDGAAHAVGRHAGVLFPKVNRAYNQGEPVQPLHQMGGDTDAEIRLVLLPRMETTEHNDNVIYAGKLATHYVLVNFWVSAKKPGRGQSEYLVTLIAERLKAILNNPDTRYALAERGVTHLNRVQVSVLPNADYHKRLVSCSATFQFPILFGDDVVTPPEADEQSVGCFSEQPLLAGEYLLGQYQWPVRAVIGAVRVIGWAPVTDVVLGLEINGAATGQTITLPAGVENVEVQSEAVMAYSVPPNQPVRWRVLSAPAAEASAWRVSLTMQVQPQG
jgi:hypothetical protein